MTNVSFGMIAIPRLRRFAPPLGMTRALAGLGVPGLAGNFGIFLILPVALANLVVEHVQDTGLMMAGSVLTTIPLLLVFLCLPRYYIEGLMAGSVNR